MKLYLYCSYTHSKRGFVMTQLTDTELTQVSLAGSENPVEQLVYRFFSFDAFRILWKALPENEKLPVLPRACGGFFGIRGLEGKISDREGVVNLALVAEKHELEQLDQIASGILADPAGFGMSLCRFLSVGGPCGYEAEPENVWELLKGVAAPQPPACLKELLDPGLPNRFSVRELLHLAVYVSTWEQAAEHLYPHWIWKICPKQAVSQEEFLKLTGKRLWQ